MESRISSKGQITVPLAVRERLGLPAGTPVTFELVDDGVVMRKGRPGDHPVDRVFGRVRLGAPVDRFVDELRGPRPARRPPARKRRAS
jgi:AbrB family looped-hinge helix DNA binding protein